MTPDDYDFTEEVLISARLLDRLWQYERAQGVSSTRALIEAIIEEWMQRQEAELPPPARSGAPKGADTLYFRDPNMERKRRLRDG